MFDCYAEFCCHFGRVMCKMSDWVYFFKVTGSQTNVSFCTPLVSAAIPALDRGLTAAHHAQHYSRRLLERRDSCPHLQQGTKGVGLLSCNKNARLTLRYDKICEPKQCASKHDTIFNLSVFKTIELMRIILMHLCNK